MVVNATTPTDEELTDLRNLALDALWRCETIRNIVLEGDDEKLCRDLPTLRDNLPAIHESAGDRYRPVVDHIERAIAIERMPSIFLDGTATDCATAWANILVVQLRMRLSFIEVDVAELRRSVQSMPHIDWGSAKARVRSEWAAATRLLNGASQLSTPTHTADEKSRDPATNLITFSEIALLTGLSGSRISSVISEWRKTGATIDDPCLYATIQPLAIETWPTKKAVLPIDYRLMRTILDDRRNTTQ